ncbi:MAG: formylglycine-generating enzyme family protein [Planctomycetota bacterium]
MNRQTGADRGASACFPRERLLNSARTAMVPLTLARAVFAAAGFCVATWSAAAPAVAQPNDRVLAIPEAIAATEAEMKPYSERIEHTDIAIPLVPIKGGTFAMGSPDSEPGRSADEGPRHEVKVAPFWMGKYEMTWDAYEIWMFDQDIQRRELAKAAPNLRDKEADEYQLSQPTAPYTDMTFGMGKRGYPAICMTQLAARVYCQWLSAKTGRYYRLPTEAEWEYACRAGTTTAYSFGDDPADIDEYAWHLDNSEEKYHPVGKKKPNPWGLYDMHGNVSEWVLDQHSKDYSQWSGSVAVNPLTIPRTEWGRVVRGGSWDVEVKKLRSAARDKSIEDWKQQDPQQPKSIWYLTDALHVGFRIVRPLTPPSADEQAAKWDKHEPFEDRKRKR